MTVKELKELLENVPDDYLVKIDNLEDYYELGEDDIEIDREIKEIRI